MIPSGRVSFHKDIGGRTTTYTYNTNGLVLTETSDSGKNKEYHYYADGNLRQFVDNALGQTVNYTYDENNNVKSKESSQAKDQKTKWKLETDYYTYDALGRIVNVRRKNPDDKTKQLANNNNQLFTINYDYDAVGNIRHIKACVNYYQKSESHQEYYFTYDANNRMLINQGVLQDNTITINQHQGTRMHYNDDGSLHDATNYQNKHYSSYVYYYDGIGRTKKIQQYFDGQVNKAQTLKVIEYDVAGHIKCEVHYDDKDSNRRLPKLPLKMVC